MAVAGGPFESQIEGVVEGNKEATQAFEAEAAREASLAETAQGGATGAAVQEALASGRGTTQAQINQAVNVDVAAGSGIPAEAITGPFATPRQLLAGLGAFISGPIGLARLAFANRNLGPVTADVTGPAIGPEANRESEPLIASSNLFTAPTQEPVSLASAGGAPTSISSSSGGGAGAGAPAAGDPLAALAASLASLFGGGPGGGSGGGAPAELGGGTATVPTTTRNSFALLLAFAALGFGVWWYVTHRRKAAA